MLRKEGQVVSRNLVELAWAAGGDPVVVTLHDDPAGTDWHARLRGFDAVIVPGGGDVQPGLYGGDDADPTLSLVEPLQDAADLSLARHAIEQGLPFLGICRGAQVLNVALGGTLVTDMPSPHRNHRSTVRLLPGAELLGFDSDSAEAFCYHHQCVSRLADGLQVIARGDDDVVEAVSLPAARAWTVGLQWHPEDIWREDARQLAPFRALIAAI